MSETLQGPCCVETNKSMHMASFPSGKLSSSHNLKSAYLCVRRKGASDVTGCCAVRRLRAGLLPEKTIYQLIIR